MAALLLAKEPAVKEQQARRRFQFSLRKLMLWTAVWAAYLGLIRAAGLGPPAAIALTVFLAVLFVIRLVWGYEKGLKIGALFAGIVPAAVGGFLIVHMCIIVPFPSIPISTVGGIMAILGMLAVIFLIGTILGLYGFLLVHGVMKAVDRADALMSLASRRSSDPDAGA